MKNILYIGTIPSSKILCGGEALNARNISLIKQIIEPNCIDFFELKPVTSAIQKIFRYLFLTPLNFSKNDLHKVMHLLDQKKYDIIFFDTSLYGQAVREIKKKYPEIKLINHFHNIEFELAKSLLRNNKMGIRHIPAFCTAWYNEHLTAKYADVNIVLNERDAIAFEKYFAKKADIMLPISQEDKFDEIKSNNVSSNPNLLFVGSAFVPNIVGMQWFVKNVMPFVNIPLNIIGRGMENYRDSLTRDNVNVIGSIEDIAPYYYEATCVVSPIFMGGGMKVKTSEALMYGKTVLATKEAFEGYLINEHIGKECNNAQEFIEAIQEIIQSHTAKKNLYSRQLYLEKYSDQAVLSIFKTLLQ